MDLQSALQSAFIGSSYRLQELLLYGDGSGTDYYVDAVHIGKTPTTVEEHGAVRTQPWFQDELWCSVRSFVR